MRTILLVLLAATCSSHRMQAQPLPNSQWLLNYPGDSPMIYLFFGADTLFWSGQSTFLPWCEISYNGNEVTLNTIEPDVLDCAVGQVGVYAYTIVDDTLTFELVSDPCAFRTLVFTGGYGVRSSVSVQELAVASGVRVQPNPASGIVTLHVPDGVTRTVQVFDLQGRVAALWSVQGPVHIADLSGILPGTYVLQSLEAGWRLPLVRE